MANYRIQLARAEFDAACMTAVSSADHVGSSTDADYAGRMWLERKPTIQWRNGRWLVKLKPFVYLTWARPIQQLRGVAMSLANELYRLEQPLQRGSHCLSKMLLMMKRILSRDALKRHGS